MICSSSLLKVHNMPISKEYSSIARTYIHTYGGAIEVKRWRWRLFSSGHSTSTGHNRHVAVPDTATAGRRRVCPVGWPVVPAHAVREASSCPPGMTATRSSSGVFQGQCTGVGKVRGGGQLLGRILCRFTTTIQNGGKTAAGTAKTQPNHGSPPAAGDGGHMSRTPSQAGSIPSSGENHGHANRDLVLAQDYINMILAQKDFRIIAEMCLEHSAELGTKGSVETLMHFTNYAKGSMKTKSDRQLVMIVVNELTLKALNGLKYLTKGRLSRLLHSHAKLGIKPVPELVQELDGLIVRGAEDLSPGHVSSIMWSFAKLDMEISISVLISLTSRAIQVMSQFSSQDISNTLWAFSKMEIQPAPELFDALKEQAFAKIDTFNSQGVSNTLHSIAKLELSPGSKLLQAMGERASHIISDFNAQELSNILWSFVRLGAAPKVEFLDEVGGRALEIIDDFNAQAVSNMVWSFSHLAYTPGARLKEAIEGRTLAVAQEMTFQGISMMLMAFAKKGELPGREVMDALHCGILKRIEDAQTRGLTLLLWAFATLGEEPGAELSSALQDRVRRLVHEFNSHDLSITLWAFATLQIQPTEALMEHLCAASLGKATSFSAHGICNVLYGLASLRYQPGQELLDKLQECAAREMGSIQELMGVVNLLQPLMLLGVRPHNLLLARMEEHSLDLIKMKCSTPHDCVQLLILFAKLRKHPLDELMHGMLDILIGSADQLSATDVSSAIWAVGALHVISVHLAFKDPVESLLQVLRKRGMSIGDDFTPQGISNILWSYSNLKMTPDGEWLEELELQARRQIASFSPQATSVSLLAIARIAERALAVGEWGDTRQLQGLVEMMVLRTSQTVGEWNSLSIINLMWAINRRIFNPTHQLLQDIEGQCIRCMQQGDFNMTNIADLRRMFSEIPGYPAGEICESLRLYEEAVKVKHEEGGRA